MKFGINIHHFDFLQTKIDLRSFINSTKDKTKHNRLQLFPEVTITQSRYIVGIKRWYYLLSDIKMRKICTITAQTIRLTLLELC